MKNAHCLQHVEYEGPQNIVTSLEKIGYELGYTKFYEERYSFPTIDSIDLLIVMGGPMGVDDIDEYPWLQDELDYIKKYVAIGKKIIGICLGAQFIAKALGAKVYKNECKEIGWSSVEISYLDTTVDQKVLHWHGDTFDIPEGCRKIATNNVTRNQGFASDNIVALQFHLEMTEVGVLEIMENNIHEINTGGKFVQNRESIINGENYRENSEFLEQLLRKFLN